MSALYFINEQIPNPLDFEKKLNSRWVGKKNLGTFWQLISNTFSHILNNFTHISIYFFTYTYIKNIQTTLLKLTDDTDSYSPE